MHVSLYKDNKIVPTAAVARLGQDIFSALVALADISVYPLSKLSRWFTKAQKGCNGSPVSLQILMNMYCVGDSNIARGRSLLEMS